MTEREPRPVAMTTLIAPAPFAERAVGALRMRYDWSARLGVPAHITLLGPFLPPTEVTDEVIERLRDLFAACPSIEVSLDGLALLGETACLMPNDDGSLAGVTDRLARAWPQAAPQQGRHHLTVARDCDAARYDEVQQALTTTLPIAGRLEEVALLTRGAGGLVGERARFALAADSELAR